MAAGAGGSLRRATSALALILAENSLVSAACRVVLVGDVVGAQHEPIPHLL